jgi:hypothetical protein
MRTQGATSRICSQTKAGSAANSSIFVHFLALAQNCFRKARLCGHYFWQLGGAMPPGRFCVSPIFAFSRTSTPLIHSLPAPQHLKYLIAPKINIKCEIFLIFNHSNTPKNSAALLYEIISVTTGQRNSALHQSRAQTRLSSSQTARPHRHAEKGKNAAAGATLPPNNTGPFKHAISRRHQFLWRRIGSHQHLRTATFAAALSSFSHSRFQNWACFFAENSNSREFTQNRLAKKNDLIAPP